MLFKNVREQALNYWLEQTGRQRQEMSELFVTECNWQNKFQVPDPDNGVHYSIFCSMGDWNTNITDMLEDTRYDELDLADLCDAGILFRYYTRFFLVVSE